MTTNEGKVALVTGASYGLGMMTADFLARDGFDIAVTDLNTDDLAETVAMVEKRGRKAFATELDVRSVDSIDAAIAATVEGMGKIDVLINNAGVPLSKPALDVEPEEFDNVQNINVRGCYFMCQRFARHLVDTDRQGAIVNLSSTFAVIGVPGVSVYGISKAAVAGITRHLAADWAKYGIRVNA
ncbi:MAG: SDR family NAD(P)-dependent oxidoreductase, partial [Alphaproteobacteria bacterium]